MFRMSVKKILAALTIAYFSATFSATTFAGDKKIGVLVFDGVLTSDVTAPLEVFGVADKKSWFTDYDVVTIAVKDVNSITTEEGLKLGVDSWIGDKQSLDALVVPSSYTMSPLLKNKQLIDFIKTTNQTASFMMSNCSGSSLLAQSGILDGKQATTWAGGESELQKNYPNVNVLDNKNVVIDGKYITSNGSVISYEAALIALAKMSSVENAKEVFDTLQMSRVTSWDRVTKLLQ